MYDNVTAIVPRGQGIGFTLAGIQVREAVNTEDAHKILATEYEDAHNGVILIDEKYARDLPSKLQKMVDERAVPLVIGIPVVTKWEYIHDREEVIANIIRRAVGYQIKLTGV
ncbi:V-type ATP synthase subunit F [Candidatus Latescibacterota bacterium]